MADQSAPLPRPHRDMIERVPNATVTRAVMNRAGRFHLGAALDCLGCPPRPGAIRTALDLLFR